MNKIDRFIKDWAKFNEVLWDRESVRFVQHQDKMRLTQVKGSDILKQEKDNLYYPLGKLKSIVPLAPSLLFWNFASFTQAPKPEGTIKV